MEYQNQLVDVDSEFKEMRRAFDKASNRPLQYFRTLEKEIQRLLRELDLPNAKTINSTNWTEITQNTDMKSLIVKMGFVHPSNEMWRLKDNVSKRALLYFLKVLSKKTCSDVRPYESLVTPVAPQAPPASPQSPPISSRTPPHSSRTLPFQPSPSPSPSQPSPSPSQPSPSPSPFQSSPQHPPYQSPFSSLAFDQTQLDSIMSTFTQTFNNAILPNFDTLKQKLDHFQSFLQRLNLSSLQSLKKLVQNVTGDAGYHVHLLEEIIQVRVNGGKFVEMAQNCEKLVLSLASQDDNLGNRAVERVRALMNSMKAFDTVLYGNQIGMVQHPLSLLQYIYNYYFKILTSHDPQAFKISGKDCLGCIISETYRTALFQAAECHEPLKSLSTTLAEEIEKFSTELSQLLEPLHIISGFIQIDPQTWQFTSTASHKMSVIGYAVTLLLQFIEDQRKPHMIRELCLAMNSNNTSLEPILLDLEKMKEQFHSPTSTKALYTTPDFEFLSKFLPFCGFRRESLWCWVFEGHISILELTIELLSKPGQIDYFNENPDEMPVCGAEEMVEFIAIGHMDPYWQIYYGLHPEELLRRN